jgi:hypothetical protein
MTPKPLLPNQANQSSGQSEFERFDTFVRKLVSVPKSEIDKAEMRYQKKKAAKKNRPKN